MSPKFVVAKLSSQTLRGLRQLCEDLNSNAKFYFYLVIHNVYSTMLSRRVLRFELFVSYTNSAKLSTLSREAVHTGLHYDFSYAPSASDIASPSPEFRWSQSCLPIFGELRILLLQAFFQLRAPSHLPHSKYDTQMTQILLEEYIFIARTSVDNSDLQNLDSLEFFFHEFIRSSEGCEAFVSNASSSTLTLQS